MNDIDIKEFKAMVKKHQCKQSFVRIIDTSDRRILNRFYQDTTNNKRYVCCWKIEEGKLIRAAFEIDQGTWSYNWHKYVSECLHCRKHAAATDKEIVATRSTIDEQPMEERKFWKIRAETLQFMLKDQRIADE